MLEVNALQSARVLGGVDRADIPGGGGAGDAAEAEGEDVVHAVLLEDLVEHRHAAVVEHAAGHAKDSVEVRLLEHVAGCGHVHLVEDAHVRRGAEAGLAGAERDLVAVDLAGDAALVAVGGLECAGVGAAGAAVALAACARG